MDAGGENVTRLNTNAGSDMFASFSPDGTQIVFSSDRAGDPDIWAMDVTGDNPAKLTSDAMADLVPSFSPDGTSIVFSSTNGFPQIRMLILRDETRTVVLYQKESTTVYQGDTALKLQASDEWEAQYAPTPPMDALGFESIRFAFHPGDVVPSQRDELQVSFVSGAQRAPSQLVDVDLEFREWQVAEHPALPFRI